MTDQDRGAYAPQDDAPLSFDARRAGVRGGPPPVTLIVSALVLLAFIGGVLLLYRHGARHPGQAPQLVGAPVGDTKSAPPSSEVPVDSSANLTVYKTEVPPPGEGTPAPAFAPPPETPQPRAVTPPPPPPVTVAPLRAAEPAPTAPPKAAPVVVAKAAPPPVAPVKVAPVKAAPAKVATPPAKTAKAVVTPAAPAAAGGAMAQVGSLPSEALAEKAWADVAHKVPGQMAGKSRKIESAVINGKTWYRAFVGGFASHADAVKFCAAVKAAGAVCIAH